MWKKYCNKKIMGYIFTFFCVLTFNFMIPRLMPGDPFTFLSSDEGDVNITYTEEQIEKYKAYYGLDKPLSEQYVKYIKDTFKGNLGYSIYYNDQVLNIIKSRIGWTVGLVLISTFLSAVIGCVLGCISAWYKNKKGDGILYFIMMGFSEIPPFLVGTLFLFILAAKYGLFPLAGATESFAEYSNKYAQIKDIVHHGFLPVLTLTISNLGGFYLLSRNSTISVLSKDYIQTAKGKGLKRRTIVFRHALRNAIFPIITRIFLSLGAMIGGAILVENVFQYPGLGKLMKEAVFVRDYPLIQGIFILVTLLVLISNFLSDIVCKKLDPRMNVD